MPKFGYQRDSSSNTNTIGPSGSDKLYPIYSLPRAHQLSKFNGSRDLAMVEEWIESIKSVTGLFTMSDKERV